MPPKPQSSTNINSQQRVRKDFRQSLGYSQEECSTVLSWTQNALSQLHNTCFADWFRQSRSLSPYPGKFEIGKNSWIMAFAYFGPDFACFWTSTISSCSLSMFVEHGLNRVLARATTQTPQSVPPFLLLLTDTVLFMKHHLRPLFCPTPAFLCLCDSKSAQFNSSVTAITMQWKFGTKIFLKGWGIASWDVGQLILEDELSRQAVIYSKEIFGFITNLSPKIASLQ